MAQLPDGLQEGQGLDVAHRAADLDDHDVVVRRPAVDSMPFLISSVTCGMTCTVLPRVVTAALLVDDRLVDLAGRVVVTVWS